jgi:hypothetical protein
MDRRPTAIQQGFPHDRPARRHLFRGRGEPVRDHIAATDHQVRGLLADAVGATGHGLRGVPFQAGMDIGEKRDADRGGRTFRGPTGGARPGPQGGGSGQRRSRAQEMASAAWSVFVHAGLLVRVTV